MRMWLLSFLVAAVIVPISVSSLRYVRPLPMGMTFEGVAGNSSTSESLVKCVETWALDLPKALVFNEKTKSCTAFSKVYGTKAASEDDRGYLITVSDENICFKGAMEDVEKIFVPKPKCRDGWTEVSFLSTTACYLVVDNAGAKYSDDTRFDVCGDLYPYSKAASIHSAEENDAVGNAFKEKSWLNVPLILTDATRYNDLKAWKWLDGTELDYNNFYRDYINNRCPTEACLSAYIARSLWYSGYGEPAHSKMFMLCKYLPNIPSSHR